MAKDESLALDADAAAVRIQKIQRGRAARKQKQSSELRQEKRRLFTSLFPEWDIDGSGAIEHNELQAVLGSTGVKAGTSKSTRKSFARWIDSSKRSDGGGLGLAEFTGFLEDLTQNMGRPEVMEFFAALQTGIAEVRTSTEDGKLKKCIYDLFRKWDIDHNGFVSFEELDFVFKATDAFKEHKSLRKLMRTWKIQFEHGRQAGARELSLRDFNLFLSDLLGPLSEEKKMEVMGDWSRRLDLVLKAMDRVEGMDRRACIAPSPMCELEDDRQLYRLPLTPSLAPDFEAHDSATCIQAHFRGHMGRKGKRQRRNSELAVAATKRRVPSAIPQVPDFEEQDASTRIQSQYRGFLARRDKEGKKARKRAAQTHRLPAPAPSVPSFEVDDAATRIQASFRGHKTRRGKKRGRNEEKDLAPAKIAPAKSLRRAPATTPVVPDFEAQDSAVRIQASFRGHKARKEAQPHEHTKTRVKEADEAKDIQDLRRRRVLFSLFPRWDLDGSGVLDADELQHVLDRMGSTKASFETKALSKTWTKWLSHVTALQQVGFNPEDFVGVMLELTKKMNEEEFADLILAMESALHAVVEASDSRKKGIWDLYQKADKNKDGVIDYDELQPVLTATQAFRQQKRLRKQSVSLKGELQQGQTLTLKQFSDMMKTMLDGMSEADGAYMLWEVQAALEGTASAAPDMGAAAGNAPVAVGTNEVEARATVISGIYRTWDFDGTGGVDLAKIRHISRAFRELSSAPMQSVIAHMVHRCVMQLEPGRTVPESTFQQLILDTTNQLSGRQFQEFVDIANAAVGLLHPLIRGPRGSCLYKLFQQWDLNSNGMLASDEIAECLDLAGSTELGEMASHQAAFHGWRRAYDGLSDPTTGALALPAFHEFISTLYRDLEGDPDFIAAVRQLMEATHVQMDEGRRGSTAGGPAPPASPPVDHPYRPSPRRAQEAQPQPPPKRAPGEPYQPSHRTREHVRSVLRQPFTISAEADADSEAQALRFTVRHSLDGIFESDVIGFMELPAEQQSLTYPLCECLCLLLRYVAAEAVPSAEQCYRTLQEKMHSNIALLDDVIHYHPSSATKPMTALVAARYAQGQSPSLVPSGLLPLGKLWTALSHWARTITTYVVYTNPQWQLDEPRNPTPPRTPEMVEPSTTLATPSRAPLARSALASGTPTAGLRPKYPQALRPIKDVTPQKALPVLCWDSEAKAHSAFGTVADTASPSHSTIPPPYAREASRDRTSPKPRTSHSEPTSTKSRVLPGIAPKLQHLSSPLSIGGSPYRSVLPQPPARSLVIARPQYCLIPHPQRMDVTGVILSPQDLQEQFKVFDRDANGCIEKEEFAQLYEALDLFGGDEPCELASLLAKYGRDGKLTFDEYCIIMLRLAQR